MATFMLIVSGVCIGALFLLMAYIAIGLRLRVARQERAMEEVIKLAEQALPAMGRDIRYLHFGLMEARSELDLPQRWDGDGQHSIH
jgi:hypothetical protein